MKVNYISVLCLRLFFIYRSIFPVYQGPFKDIYIRCVPVLTKTIAAQDRKNCEATEAILNASGANQGTFLQIS